MKLTIEVRRSVDDNGDITWIISDPSEESTYISNPVLGDAFADYYLECLQDVVEANGWTEVDG